MRSGSLRLMKISGINVFVHWSFLILVAWVIVSGIKVGQNWTAIIFSLAFVFIVFICITFHELGHALTARRYGVQTKDITLLPIGGVARMDKFPENPKQEFLIAVAGPLVNFAISLILYLYYLIIFRGDMGNPLELQINLKGLLVNVIIANLAIGIFNLIPAFPMDGGRILRSLLAMRTDRVSATKMAASIGQTIAVFFAITGVFFNPFLIIIAIFVFIGAQYESSAIESISFLEGYKVSDVMRTKYTVLSGDDPVSKAVDELLAGADQDFVVVNQEKVIGILLRTQLIRAISENKMIRPIREIVNDDFKDIEVSGEIKNLYTLMQEKKYSILPVMDKGRFVGIVDLENLLEFIMIKSALGKKFVY